MMPYTLVNATGSVVMHGRSMAGCPLFLHDGRLAFVPSWWALATRLIRSPDTVKSYAQHLKAWLEYLEDRECPWWQADNEDVVAFCLMRQTLGASNRTINSQAAAVRSFYTWTYDNGLSTARFVNNTKWPWRYNSSTPPSRLPTIDAIPRYNTAEEFDSICASAPRQNAGLALRDEIIAECGRFMGLRRQETAGLTLAAIQKATFKGRLGTLWLDGQTTKGRKARFVPFPQPLHHKMRRYIEVYRSAVVERARRKDISYVEPPQLFLKFDGQPIRREYVSAFWRSAAKSAGIPSRNHWGRHALLTAIVSASKRKGKHPLLLAQQIAGHAHMSTTSVYDHSESPLVSDLDSSEIVEGAWRDL